MIRTVVPLALLLLTLAESSAAIIIRHDRPDDRYRELGRRFPAVSAFGRAGAGTLVSSQWVLTAAHVAAGMRRDATIPFRGVPYQAGRIVLHPEWKDMGAKDIALVSLTKPVKGVAPLPIYEGRNEVGKEIIFVGNGGTGTGLTGPHRPEDGILRGATNIVDSADDEWLYFRFDEPPAGTDLEGISGPGDSGGPAILQDDGAAYVLGVSVFGRPGTRGRGTYSATEGYTRVSSHVRWIRSVVGSR